MSVSHVLLKCSTYCGSRVDFLIDFQKKLENVFESLIA